MPATNDDLHNDLQQVISALNQVVAELGNLQSEVRAQGGGGGANTQPGGNQNQNQRKKTLGGRLAARTSNQIERSIAIQAARAVVGTGQAVVQGAFEGLKGATNEGGTFIASANRYLGSKLSGAAETVIGRATAALMPVAKLRARAGDPASDEQLDAGLLIERERQGRIIKAEEQLNSRATRQFAEEFDIQTDRAASNLFGGSNSGSDLNTDKLKRFGEALDKATRAAERGRNSGQSGF